MAPPETAPSLGTAATDKNRLDEKPPDGEEVSTDLTLWWSSTNSINMDNMMMMTTSDVYVRQAEEDEEDIRRFGVSTKLKLYEDPWKIKKSLTASDVGNMSRLLLPVSAVNSYVLPFLDGATVEKVLSEFGVGATVVVSDEDTATEHFLVLKRWWSSMSFVLKGGWKEAFVRRRNLHEGDVVGLWWDPFNSRFCFRVLDCASRV